MAVQKGNSHHTHSLWEVQPHMKYSFDRTASMSEYSFEPYDPTATFDFNTVPLIHKTQEPLCHQYFVFMVTLRVLVPEFVQQYTMCIWPPTPAVPVYLMNFVLLVTTLKFCHLSQVLIPHPFPHSELHRVHSCMHWLPDSPLFD
jgi:hypothetical protein